MQRHVAPFVVAAVLVVPSAARALEAPAVDDELEEEALGPRGNLHTRADDVSFDARERSLELSGNVRVDAAPFHLRSDRIRLARTRYGVEADGKGSLAFCPCLGTPLTVDFDRAIVAPPGDLVLHGPTLRVYGVPLLHLPYFWLRSDEKLGVLPPDVAYRAQDGLYVGEGLHVPFVSGGKRNALDLRGGAYLFDGFVADARLRTPTSSTKVRYDRLPGAPAPAIAGTPANTDDGLVVEARGASPGAGTSVAWDADVVRGRRGVASTTELDAAAKPWDRAAAEGSLRVGPIIASTGVRAVTRRGGGLVDVDAGGPVAALRSSGPLGSRVTYDATAEGGALRVTGAAATPGAITPETVSFARAEVGALGATTFGPVAASLAVRGAGDVVAASRRDGSDRAASARVHVGVPLARAFGAEDDVARSAADGGDPWIHTIEPFVEAAVLHAHGDSALGVGPGRGLEAIDGTAPLTEAGLATALGRWGRREALDLALAGGAAYGSSAVASGVRPLARARVAATLGWLGLSGDGGLVIGEAGAPSAAAVAARARVGWREGIHVLGNVAARGPLDPVLARVLSDAPLEPPVGFFAQEGTTGGAGLVVPWSRLFATSAGADADLTRGELVAARGGFELHDRCGCLTLRANGAHRIGRSGVDVWVALDFVADR